ncbi:MAG: type II toxin-antitoxin system RelE/ParE family toxin [Candidatus Wallbacteria bacterium]|nr:type II toxin-antitoxin system RelE/ParE family toxin [Candidatus Wallbacteria bacterium]
MKAAKAIVWQITWLRDAQKAFEQLPSQEKPRILEAFKSLVSQPLQGPNIKKLKGKQQGYYRYRQGDYRVLYEVLTDEHKVRIIGILQRADAYKKS